MPRLGGSSLRTGGTPGDRPAQSGLGEGQYRLFIALLLPETVKAEIEHSQAALRRALPAAGITWTRPEQFHLTLKFLGGVAARRVGELAEAMRGVGDGFRALPLRAERAGCFPDLRFPRVIWVGVRDQREQLPRLQRAVEAAGGAFTAQKPEGRFAGHVTLGRIKRLSRPETEALAGLVQGLAERFFGAWVADRLAIMRSELSPTGARHTVVATVPLGAQIPRQESA